MEKHSIRDAEQRTQTICLLILSTVAIGVALLYLRQVLVPFVLAAFLTMAVTPILDYMRRKFRMPRGMAIAVTLSLACFVLVLIGSLVSTGLQDVVEKRQVYVAQVGGLVDAADGHARTVRENWEGFLNLFGGEQDNLGEDNTAEQPSSSAAPNEQATTQAGPADDSVQATPGTPSTLEGTRGTLPEAATGDNQAGPSTKGGSREPNRDFKAKVARMVELAITWALNSVATLMSQGLLVMIFMIFLITGYRSGEDPERRGLRHEIGLRVKDYLRVKFLVSTLTGVSTYLILRVLGVDLALVFGLAAFFLNFIPNIGSLVAVFLPLPVVLLAPAEVLSLADQVLAMALPALVQFLVGNLLEPRMMGKSLDLNPIVILMFLIFWGVLWGPVGMLLSVPITAVLKMLLERSELTQPLAVLLSEDG